LVTPEQNTTATISNAKLDLTNSYECPIIPNHNT
jgi:hypothetical protein